MKEKQMFSEAEGDDRSADRRKFHQAAAFTCLTSALMERQRREAEGGVRVRACVCVYKSQVTPVPADGARAGLSLKSSACACALVRMSEKLDKNRTILLRKKHVG